MNKLDSTWFAFLAMTIAVVGLTGLFVSYAAPIPLQRALQRDAALNEARAALATADPQAAIERLRPRLGDSAAALLPPGGPAVAGMAAGAMAARIEAERTAMHERLGRDAETVALRLRWLLGIVTLMAAIFGMGILGIATRQPTRDPGSEPAKPAR